MALSLIKIMLNKHASKQNKITLNLSVIEQIKIILSDLIDHSYLKLSSMFGGLFFGVIVGLYFI